MTSTFAPTTCRKRHGTHVCSTTILQNGRLRTAYACRMKKKTPSPCGRQSFQRRGGHVMPAYMETHTHIYNRSTSTPSKALEPAHVVLMPIRSSPPKKSQIKILADLGSPLPSPPGLALTERTVSCRVNLLGRRERSSAAKTQHDFPDSLAVQATQAANSLH